MQIVKSKYTGFCAGVERAVRALETARVSQPFDVLLSSIIVHNMKVSSSLNAQIFDPDVKYINPYFILIAAHGCEKGFLDKLKKGNIPYADATCPVVEQNLKSALEHDGDIIYIADKEHSEARFFLSFMRGKKVAVISTLAQCKECVKEFKCMHNPLIVVQTTFSSEKYAQITSFLSKHIPNAKLCKSICPDCLQRRREVISLARDCDCVVVVGDGISSNARELVSISKSVNENTFLLLDSSSDYIEKIKKNPYFKKIGLISSASSSLEIFNSIADAIE